MFLFFFSSIFLFHLTPIEAGISLFFLALFICTSIAHYYTFWIALSLLILFIRGLLVLIAYFVALSPARPRPRPRLVPICLLGLPFSFLWIPQPLSTWSKTSHLSSFFTEPNALILIFCFALLFVLMIAVVKITGGSRIAIRLWQP